MNGKLAVNIDEEALFEVLVAANFGAPAGKTAGKVPAGVIESIAEPNWNSPRLPDPRNQNAARLGASPLF